MQKLTKKQEEIYYLLTREFLTQKQIGSRLKISKQTVHKIIKILQRKGHLSFIKNGWLTRGGVTPKPSQPLDNFYLKRKVRLHNQHLVIRILFRDHNYNIFRDKVTNFKLEGNTIKLNRETVEIYSNTSFFDESTDFVKKQSMEYWLNLIVRLENDLKIILYKDRVNNIKIVREHYSEVNNELAKDYNKRKEKLSIKDPGDNKEWLKIDNSFQLDELETVHPKSAQGDMNIVKSFFNDLRINPVKLSDILSVISANSKSINDLAEYTKDASETLKYTIETLKLLIPKKEKVEEVPEEDLSIPDYIN